MHASTATVVLALCFSMCVAYRIVGIVCASVGASECAAKQCRVSLGTH